jgi:hypothetical protein
MGVIASPRAVRDEHKCRNEDLVRQPSSLCLGGFQLAGICDTC